MPRACCPASSPTPRSACCKQLVDDAEIIVAINANDIEKNKLRGDLGITYDEDVLRLHGHLPRHGLSATAAAW